MSQNHFFVLLSLKAKLLARMFSWRHRGVTLVAFVALGLASAPIWSGTAAGAYLAAVRLGSPAVATGFGLVHLSWIASALLMGSFAEGFDLRGLLRYPLSPRAVFWLNVLVAPFDLVALFLLPALAALSAGAAARAGVRAGVGVALAGLLQLTLTSAVTQTLLAGLGRYVRREWTRALCGVAVGLTFAVPALLMSAGLTEGRRISANVAATAQSLLNPAGHLFAWFPTTAFPVRAAGAAVRGSWLGCAVSLALGTGLLVVLCELGARLAAREALNRQAVGVTAGDRGTAIGSRLVARFLPLELGTLLGRELRYVFRTPQVLVGLFMSPLSVLALPRQPYFAVESRPLLLAFLCLVAALNLSANQFGLDQTGVRLLFLLPIGERQLLLAKNLACAAMVAVAAAIAIPLAAFMKPGLDVTAVATTLAALGAALPVVLIIGNFLSVRQPWRMSFRLGGTPPGAVISAGAQLGAVALVAFLLLPPLLILPALLGSSPAMRLGSLLAVSVLAAVLWLVWRATLGGASRRLKCHRERIVDRLGRAHEMG